MHKFKLQCIAVWTVALLLFPTVAQSDFDFSKTIPRTLRAGDYAEYLVTTGNVRVDGKYAVSVKDALPNCQFILAFTDINSGEKINLRTDENTKYNGKKNIKNIELFAVYVFWLQENSLFPTDHLFEVIGKRAKSEDLKVPTIIDFLNFTAYRFGGGDLPPWILDRWRQQKISNVELFTLSDQVPLPLHFKASIKTKNGVAPREFKLISFRAGKQIKNQAPCASQNLSPQPKTTSPQKILTCKEQLTNNLLNVNGPSLDQKMKSRTYKISSDELVNLKNQVDGILLRNAKILPPEDIQTNSIHKGISTLDWAVTSGRGISKEDIKILQEIKSKTKKYNLGREDGWDTLFQNKINFDSIEIHFAKQDDDGFIVDSKMAQTSILIARGAPTGFMKSQHTWDLGRVDPQCNVEWIETFYGKKISPTFCKKLAPLVSELNKLKREKSIFEITCKAQGGRGATCYCLGKGAATTIKKINPHIETCLAQRAQVPTTPFDNIVSSLSQYSDDQLDMYSGTDWMDVITTCEQYSSLWK